VWPIRIPLGVVVVGGGVVVIIRAAALHFLWTCFGFGGSTVVAGSQIEHGQ
jgi:hypothetical protein